MLGTIEFMLTRRVIDVLVHPDDHVALGMLPLIVDSRKPEIPIEVGTVGVVSDVLSIEREEVEKSQITVPLV